MRQSKRGGKKASEPYRGELRGHCALWDNYRTEAEEIWGAPPAVRNGRSPLCHSLGDAVRMGIPFQLPLGRWTVSLNETLSRDSATCDRGICQGYT